MSGLIRRLLRLPESTEVEDRNDAARDQALTVIRRANEETRVALDVIHELRGKPTRSALGNAFGNRQDK